ncbi:hypothetical protein CIB84_012906 [Bambusicola thoracicus]|uniref:Fibronectin type-III domain-containing protein n=1 Tax=Bambusicola thoracicus TaxID=9083 RepID=A0A2P4SGX9_BAMTH|nr:hypothetical protein CIB84_012906 [Bambusicola thoracicus]
MLRREFLLSETKIENGSDLYRVPQKVSELKAGGGGWLRTLRVNWLPPAGDLERYHLLLWNHSALVLNATLGKNVTEYLVRDVGLIPGRQYEVEVVVESGDLQSRASCTGRTVPAQVTSLTVASQGSTNSLFTNWTKALGDVDSYQVLLIHENVVIKNETVPSETNEYHFYPLKPGGLYSVVVTTVSGGISSRQTIAEGRTECPPVIFTVYEALLCSMG